MKTINLEDIAKEAIYNYCLSVNPDFNRDYVDMNMGQPFDMVLRDSPLLPAMLEAVKQTIELCAENAEYETEGYFDEYLHIWVDKKSILNTINQIR